MSGKLLTINKILNLTTDYFKNNNIETPKLDAEILLAYILNVPRIQLIAEPSRELFDSEINEYRKVVKDRAAGKPVAYIIGKKEFFGLEFIVNKNVLIPRPETEHLVSFALKHFSDMGTKTLNILDIGCGSGCIGIVLTKKLSSANTIMTDVSADALELAYENIIKHGLLDKIKIIKSDLFDAITDCEHKFDLIISNPPYISEKEIPDLNKNILKYEPKNALISGDTGIEIILNILEESNNYLTDRGLIIIEISPLICYKIIEWLEKNKKLYSNYTIIKDYAGKERMLVIGDIKNEKTKIIDSG